MYFLPDERVHSQKQSKTTVLVPPFLELCQILEGASSERELANVEILQRNEKGVELVHDLRLGAR